MMQSMANDISISKKVLDSHSNSRLQIPTDQLETLESKANHLITSHCDEQTAIRMVCKQVDISSRSIIDLIHLMIKNKS